MRRLDDILQANQQFLGHIKPANLPTRAPEPLAVITCIDPRVNLAAIGLRPFDPDGTAHSNVRVIRTIGGMADERSLVIGLFLAGFREFVVLMHTDCGCRLAHDHIDTLIKNMEEQLPPADFQQFQSEIGQPFRDRLRGWLKVFEDPYAAVQQEIRRLQEAVFIPPEIILHGLVYDTASGRVDVVVNGYDAVLS